MKSELTKIMLDFIGEGVESVGHSVQRPSMLRHDPRLQEKQWFASFGFVHDMQDGWHPGSVSGSCGSSCSCCSGVMQLVVASILILIFKIFFNFFIGEFFPYVFDFSLLSLFELTLADMLNNHAEFLSRLSMIRGSHRSSEESQN